jgi:hypothetical protein
MNDIYTSLSLFSSPEAGIVYVFVIGLLELIIKPIMYKYLNGKRQMPVTKKVVLPLLVCGLTILGASFVRPEMIDTVPEIGIYGFALGVVANFLYRIGLSSMMKKLGIEEKISGSIFPPPRGPDEQ